jgi:hypothetical protein
METKYIRELSPSLWFTTLGITLCRLEVSWVACRPQNGHRIFPDEVPLGRDLSSAGAHCYLYAHRGQPHDLFGSLLFGPKLPT